MSKQDFIECSVKALWVVLIFALAVFLLSGCLVTGSIEYQDPKNPNVNARIGISKSFRK